MTLNPKPPSFLSDRYCYTNVYANGSGLSSLGLRRAAKQGAPMMIARLRRGLEFRVWVRVHVMIARFERGLEFGVWGRVQEV